MADNIIHLVLAKIEGGPEGIKGVSLFIVPKFMVKEDGSQVTMQAQTEAGAVSLLVCDYKGGELRGYVDFDPAKLAELGARIGVLEKALLDTESDRDALQVRYSSELAALNTALADAQRASDTAAAQAEVAAEAAQATEAELQARLAEAEASAAETEQTLRSELDRARAELGGRISEFDEVELRIVALEAALAYPYAQTADAMAHQVAAFQKFRPQASLEQITSPTLILYAAQDTLVPPALARPGFSAIPNKTEITVADAGHSIIWDTPSEVAAHLSGFLQDHPIR